MTAARASATSAVPPVPHTSLKIKIQSLQLHVPRGLAAQGSSRVQQERDKKIRGSKNKKMTAKAACNTAAA